MASLHTSPSFPSGSVSHLQATAFTSRPTSIADYDKIRASWSKAVELFNSRLTKDEKKKIDVKNCPQAPFSDLLSAAHTAKNQVEKSRYPWTEVLRRILDQINRFAHIGDLIVQHHAEYTSLVWGTFRFLLLFAIEEQKSAEKLSSALDSVVQIICRAEEYAKLFSAPSDSTTDGVFYSLQDNLTSLYAEVLNFLIRATIFYQKGTLHRYVSAGLSSDTKFQGILDQIHRYECNVEKDKSLLESEARKKQQEYENGIWLQHADFEADLQKLYRAHITGTCGWFLRNEAYTRWRQMSPASPAASFLWVQGKPGCGKSVIASQIIRDISSFEGATILYVFCKAGQEDKNSLDSLLRNLVFQLLIKSSKQPLYHQSVFKARMNEKTLFVQSMETLWRLLAYMLQEESVCFCVLDGLDECDNSKPEREAFITRLTDTFEKSCCQTRTMVVSQLEKPGFSHIRSLWEFIQIRPSDIRDDINTLTSARIRDSGVLKNHPKKSMLVEKIVANSDGMMLWAELMVQEVEAGHWNVERVLEKPPRGLSALYSVIINRMRKAETAIDQVQYALKHVLAAARPLRLEELALSIAVVEGLQQHSDYDQRGNAATEGRAIVQNCSPLLGEMPDGTVQLTHSSLKDYLLGPDVPSDLTSFHFGANDIHGHLASLLIKYMSFQCFRMELLEQTQPEKYFLIEYASVWLVHHCTKTVKATHIEKELTDFFRETQGWRWLQRLSGCYMISFGHLQVWQTEMKEWAQALDLKGDTVSLFSNLLLILSQNRLKEQSSLGDDDHSYLASMSYLATTFWNQGRWKEAEELDVQVMEMRKKVLGSEHSDTLSSIANLATTFGKQGRWKEAEELEVQVMEMKEKVLGSEHPDMLLSIGNLASTYQNQGRWKEAEELKVQVMKMRKKVLGSEHPNTLISMGNLASTFWKQKRWKEAEELEVQVMEMREKVLGSEHPDTLSSIANLASTFWKQGRWKEAEELNVQVMEMREKVLGSEHPDTLSSIANLASTFWEQGRWKEAEELEVQVMETTKRVLGSEHPDTLVSMNNLAHTYKAQDRQNQAMELMKEVIWLRSRIIGVDHPDTVSSMNSLESWTVTMPEQDLSESAMLRASASAIEQADD